LPLLFLFLLFPSPGNKVSPATAVTVEHFSNFSIKLESLSEEVRELKKMIQLTLELLEKQQQ